MVPPALGRRVRPLPGRARASRRARGRTTAWLHAHSYSLPLVAGLLLVVGLVLKTGAAGYPGFTDDEGTYVAQAWAVKSQHALAHYTYWYDHPPLGWLQLAFLSSIFGPFIGATGSVAEARAVMLLPALVSAALVYVLARRLGLRRTFAAIAVVLFALSPLAVSSLRQVYLDNIALPWMLAAFVLAASPRQRLWAYAASGACFAIAVLSKETFLLVLPGLVLLLREGLDPRRRAFCLTAFGSVFVIGVLAFPLFALLKGELFPGAGHVSLLEALQFQLVSRPSTGSALSPGSVSHQLVESWMRTDSWLLGLGMLLTLPAMAIRRLRPVAVALLVLIVMMLRPGYLPQPYFIAMLPFCALVVAGMLDAALSASLARRPGEGRFLSFAGGGIVAAVLLFSMAPTWHRADAYALHQRQNDGVMAAERWTKAHVDPRSRILVDDTLYLDLVQAGFRQQYGVVWFYKLDFTTNLDPSIAQQLPQGWRSFDYVVSTPVVRSALAQNPGGLQQVRLALRHSKVSAAFGQGPHRVEVRRIVGTGTGSGLVPRKAKRSSRRATVRHRAADRRRDQRRHRRERSHRRSKRR